MHGTIFEFLRNEFLNANDFFLNRTGQRRPVLKEIGGTDREGQTLFSSAPIKGHVRLTALRLVNPELLAPPA